jgi:Na+/proline symporter
MSIRANVIVFAAILLPAILYFYKSWRARSEITGLADFFPLKREYSARQFRSTTVAAGMSLATVMIAFINLAPLLGISLMISVITFCLSFVFLYFCIPSIMNSNKHNLSVQGFLGKAYGSKAVKRTALTFSLLGYLSIFSMELLVGVTVLSPFLGQWVLAFAVVYLVFLVVYSMVSGFKAVVATDIWQLRFIILSIVALGIHLCVSASRAATSVSFIDATRLVFGDWRAPLSFCLGIAIMNLPAPISDAGTWQRLCAAKDAKTARSGLLQVIALFLVLWSALVLLGNYFTAAGVFSIETIQSHGSLMAAITTSMAAGGVLNSLLLFVFILGLFSAMISTADSLLIVASQIFSMDLLSLHADSPVVKAHPLRATRLSMAVMAVVSFSIFVLFHMIKFDVVQLVFAIYGAQLALFPSVFAALFLSRRINLLKARHAALLSIAVGFSLAWAFALYGKFAGSMDCQFYAPVAGFVGSLLTYFLTSLGAWKKQNA